MFICATIQVKGLLFPWKKELLSYLRDENLLRVEPPKGQLVIDEAESMGYGQREWRGILNDFADSGRILQAVPEDDALESIELLQDTEIQPLFQINHLTPRGQEEMQRWMRLWGLGDFPTLYGPADFLASMLYFTPSEGDAMIFSEVNRNRGLGTAFVVQTPSEMKKVIDKVLIAPIKAIEEEEEEEGGF